MARHIEITEALVEAARKARLEILAHWTREELEEHHCGVEVALARLEDALRLAGDELEEI